MQSNGANWYLAKMVFRIVCGEGRHRPQYDEQWRLLRANNCSDAVKRAEQLALQEGLQYLHQQSLPVTWQWVGVAGLHQLDADAEGSELLSVIREPYDEDLYLSTLHKEMYLPGL